MYYPELFTVTQHFDRTSITDIPGAVRRAITENPAIKERAKAGMRVAVLVGSRGIANLPEIVKATLDCLQGMGLSPFITPCMGSHGGGTSEGQVELLDGLGISEKSMGVPIHAQMDVETLGQIPGGPGVYFSTEALKADLIVPIVRVKMHTRLVGNIGSGFCKMLCIGAGKIAGAQEYHRYGVEKPMRPAAEMILEKVDSLYFGLGIVENALDKVHTVKALLPQDFVQTDIDLLALANGMFPSIPVKKSDVLIVEKMGKDISGAGADVNVIGKWRRDGGKRDPDYDIQAVLDITDVSHGNAMGMGNFDLATEYFRDQLDLGATYTNAISSTRFRAARLPLIVKNDKTLLETIINSRAEPEKLSVMVIESTAELEHFWITRNLFDQLDGNAKVSISDTPQPFRFDANGRLIRFQTC